MRQNCLLFSLMLSFLPGFAQSPVPPPYFHPINQLNRELQNIVHSLELDRNFDVGADGIEQISLAVVDLTSGQPQFAGVHAENFIYPASVYKMYVAAEILHQVSLGEITLDSVIVVKCPNIVDKTKQIPRDPRPLLQDGDTVTINYLLDLMITRSDNSAANCLIDIAKRPRINAMLQSYNWNGSEVTRKFLSRKYEDPGYAEIRGTETCAVHAADFLYRIQMNQLINPWVSMQMKVLLGRQLDKSKFAGGLPKNSMYYHKTGWFSYWTHDVGIVDDGQICYIVACFLPIEEERAVQIYPELARKLDQMMQSRHGL